jgi:hypothetical protein
METFMFYEESPIGSFCNGIEMGTASPLTDFSWVPHSEIQHEIGKSLVLLPWKVASLAISFLQGSFYLIHCIPNFKAYTSSSLSTPFE